MTIWIIEPRDPLIVRDGRPFGPDPGARAATLPFPFPSAIAGGLRGLAGRTKAQSFNTELKDDVLNYVHVRGPLLVELDDAKPTVWFAPTPADASIHQTERYDKERGTLVRLIPATTLADSAYSDTDDGLLTQAGSLDPHKAHPLAPQFWRWEHFEQWLLHLPVTAADLLRDGIRTLETDARMHVKIKAETQTADEGFLYQTRGLEFTTKTCKRLALAAQVEVTANADTLFANFAGGMAPLGGERRLMRWERCDTTLPIAPEGLFAQIGEQRACRIVLLTPAYFEAGYKPDLANLAANLHPELVAAAANLHPKLVAAAVPRAQVASGWDMLHDNGNDENNKPRPPGAPKPARRLAPTGAVYFVRFDEHDDKQAIEDWARKLWMQCISDDEQSRRDGFGLVALGVWDGKSAIMGGRDATTES